MLPNYVFLIMLKIAVRFLRISCSSLRKVPSPKRIVVALEIIGSLNETSVNQFYYFILPYSTFL